MNKQINTKNNAWISSQVDKLLGVGALQQEYGFEKYVSFLYHVVHLSDLQLAKDNQLLHHAFLTIVVCLAIDPNQ